MIAMSMVPPHAEGFRRPRIWLVPVLLFAIVPKCIVCLISYAGLGIALGLGEPELCSDSGAAASWMRWLPGLGLAAIVILSFMLRRDRRV